MKIEYKLHSQLSESELCTIINLKNKVWNYPIESHYKWIKENIRENDIHVLLYDNGQLKGYLNLVNIEVLYKNDKINFLGIGNVCVDPSYQSKGLGQLLMRNVNEYLIDKNIFGILICKDKLIPFYSLSDWEVYNYPVQNKTDIINKNGINVMIKGTCNLDGVLFIDRIF